MKNITFYEQINLFLKNKGQGNPHFAYTGLIHAYAGMDLRTQLGFQKPMKDKFFALKTEVWNEPTLTGSCSKPSFFNYIKPYVVYFKNTENPKGKPKIH